MEINRLQQFRTVFETENMREAASLLGMSPGAISKSIKCLETELGVNLFVQKGRNIVPTEMAFTFYNKSSDFMESYHELIGSLSKEPKVSNKVIRIVSWEVFSSYFTAYLAEEHFPDYKFEVIERSPHHLEQAILRGETDIGITYAPAPHKDLTIIKIKQFEYGVFAKKSFFEKLSVDQLPFAVPITQVNSSPSGIRTLDCWPDDKKRTIKYRLELLETALDMTRRGLAVIHCPRFVIKLQNSSCGCNLVELPIFKASEKVKKSVFLVFRKSMAENQEVKRVAKALRQTL